MCKRTRNFVVCNFVYFFFFFISRTPDKNKIANEQLKYGVARVRVKRKKKNMNLGQKKEKKLPVNNNSECQCWLDFFFLLFSVRYRVYVYFCPCLCFQFSKFNSKWNKQQQEKNKKTNEKICAEFKFFSHNSINVSKFQWNEIKRRNRRKIKKKKIWLG